MSVKRNSSQRDGAVGKKANEMRISEDFYARMESDVKSLVKQMRPGSSNKMNDAKDDDDKPLFSVASPPRRDLSEMKDKKRKRPETAETKPRRTEAISTADDNAPEETQPSKKKKSATSDDSNGASTKKAASATTSSSSSTNATTAAPNQTSHHYANEKTVYVSGLPFTCTEEDIRTFFKEVGNIKSIRLPRWHDSGKLRGYGHVEFGTKAAADAAMDLSGQYIGNRFVNVDRPMVPRAAQPLVAGSATATASGADDNEEGNTATTATAPSRSHPAGCRTIFMKNLPYDVTEEEIRQHFMVYGPITNIRLAGWNHTNNLKGFGYVEYKREDSTEIAVKKNGTIVIRDRRIVVDYDTAAPKGSYRNPNAKDANKNKNFQHKKSSSST